MPTSERPLPHASESESSVMSCMLQNPEHCVARGQELGLTEQSFYMPSNRMLFRVLLKRLEKEEPCGIAEMTQALLHIGELENVGGWSGLTTLFTLAPTEAFFDYNVGLVRNAQACRAVIDRCGKAALQAGAGDADGMEVLSDTIGALESVRDGHESNSSGRSRHIKEILPAVVDAIEDRMNGVSKEWLPLPWRFIKITRGGAAIIAARPGKGKSAFLENIAKHLAVHEGEPTCIISLEMSGEMLAERSLSGEAEVQTKSNGQLVRKDLEKLLSAKQRLDGSGFYIADMPGATADEVILEMRRMQRNHGVNTFCIDYIQDIGAADVEEARSNKMRIDNALRKFDVFRKKSSKGEHLMTHVFAAQSDRKADELMATQMYMSLLADSSVLEKIAYQVVFLGPNEKTDLSQDVVEMDAHIAKNREGDVGYVPLRFHKKFTKWTESLSTNLLD